MEPLTPGSPRGGNPGLSKTDATAPSGTIGAIATNLAGNSGHRDRLPDLVT